MIIAVDFDGTIVEDYYPFIGAELPNALTILKKLQAEGFKLILWTSREGKSLTAAVDFCHQRGLDFYAVNSNYPGEQTSDTHYSRKIKAHIFIDDRTLQDLPDWQKIYDLVKEKAEKQAKLYGDEEEEIHGKAKRFLKKILKIQV